MSPASHPPIERPLGDVDSDRLTLRRIRAGDETLLAPVFAKPEVWHFPLGRGCTAAETRVFVERRVAEWDALGFGLWLATERATSTVLGYVGLSVPTFLPEILPTVEVGWRLDPAAWGHGYATEGATVAVREAFETLGLPEAVSIIEPDNTRSVRVAERLGMTVREPTMVAAEVEVQVFALTATDWSRS